MAEEAKAQEIALNEEKDLSADIKKYLIFSSNEKLFGVDTDYVETILTKQRSPMCRCCPDIFAA